VVEAVDFRVLFESCPVTFLVLDPQLRIVAVTDAYLTATMAERTEILGRGVFEVFPDNPDDSAAEGVRNLRVSLERVLRERVTDVMPVQRYDVRRSDGSFEQRFWSPSNSPVLDGAGAVRYVIHRVEDVTEFVRLQASRAVRQREAPTQRMEQEVFARANEVAGASRQLKEANAELADLYQRTKQLDELKSQFFANVSHELRTPLMLILEPARKLLAAASAGEPGKAELELIVRNAQLLLRQVNNLLDAARLEAGAVRPDYTRIDAADEVRLGASFFESLAVDRDIQLRVESPAPILAEIDREHLQRILVNVLSNAFKFTQPGGTVRCSVSLRGDDRIAIEVADSGPGIPTDQRTTVFDRFRQVEGGATRSAGGTGLGLSIVRDLVELHRGSVTIADAPEGGALVVIELPRTAPAGAPIRTATHHDDHQHRVSDTAGDIAELDAASPLGTRQSPGPDAKPVIVLIEDNADLNAFVRQALAERYRVEVAFDGRSGLELARAQRPDLIVCDIMMPQLSGDQLLEQARADPRLADTPILILSARADDQSRLALLHAGANDYLSKPFQINELQARVDNLINARLAEANRRLLRIFDERERIALELHHTVVDRLFSIGVKLSGARPLVRVPAAADRIDEAVTDLDEAIDQIRRTINELDTSAYTTGDFRTQLSEILGETAETLGAGFELSFSGALDSISDDITAAMNNAVRNVMTEILHRAIAAEITLSAIRAAGLVIAITEKARATATVTPLADQGTLLPDSLRALGAQMVITTPASDETTWTWTIPLLPNPSSDRWPYP
jgi:PAS domain S-box-containing protein